MFGKKDSRFWHACELSDFKAMTISIHAWPQTMGVGKMVVLIGFLSRHRHDFNLATYVCLINICTKESDFLEDAAATVTIGVTKHICEFMKMSCKQSSTLILGDEIMDGSKCYCQTIFDGGSTAHLIHDDLQQFQSSYALR